MTEIELLSTSIMCLDICNPVPPHNEPSQDRPNLYGAA
jgi:hypothetical protein